MDDPLNSMYVLFHIFLVFSIPASDDVVLLHFQNFKKTNWKCQKEEDDARCVIFNTSEKTLLSFFFFFYFHFLKIVFISLLRLYFCKTKTNCCNLPLQKNSLVPNENSSPPHTYKKLVQNLTLWKKIVPF